jgi:acetyltransferase-like isoleucine patch superfamily enzyme
MIVTYLPGTTGETFRYRYWKKRLRYLGKNVKIDIGVFFQNPSYIKIDDNCWIDRNVFILGGLDNSHREKIVIHNSNYRGEPGIVEIGKNVHIGPHSILSGISAGIYISDNCGFSAGCKVYAFSHHYRSRKNPKDTRFHFGPMVSMDCQCLIEGPVFLGHNTGVALNYVILPGVSIPENCFVVVNSVVGPGRYSCNSLIAGQPARRVEDRFRTDA